MQNATHNLRVWLLLLCLLTLAYLPASQGPSHGSTSALEALGWRLLAEQRLSADGASSCFSCHRPELGYGDGLPTARPGGLNTPPLWGLAERRAFGWFSPELNSLEAAALRPLADPHEMGPLRETSLERLRADAVSTAAYRAAFPTAAELVTWEQTAAALAAALRTIPAPAGAPAPLSTAAQRGQALFSELGCAACHRPPRFADDSYHNLGLGADPARNAGRARVPALRGLAHTAPYFHDGSAATLADVVAHYARGGQPGQPVSPAISPLLLTTQDVDDLVAFLEGL
jgi:cytochrome c peroxidase